LKSIRDYETVSERRRSPADRSENKWKEQQASWALGQPAALVLGAPIYLQIGYPSQIQ